MLLIFAKKGAIIKFMKSIKEILATNLTNLRLERGWTQSELAEKLNYTDKSISKWEHGETTPPIDVLKELSTLYDVSLDFLTTDSPDETYDRVFNDRRNKTNKIIITCLAVSLVWLASTIFYVYTSILLNKSYWISFVIAVPLSVIVLMIFNGIWGKRIYKFYLTSILIWSILTTIFLLVPKYNLWIIYILGVPLQIATILWSFLRSNKSLVKNNPTPYKIRKRS